MSGKHILIILFVFTLCISNNALAAEPQIIAEYTGRGTGALGIWNSETGAVAQAQAFDVNVADGNMVSEILLRLERDWGSAGEVIMQLRQDSNRAPSTQIEKEISIPVSDVPDYPWTTPWSSFMWPKGQETNISPGRWWIVCKLSPDSGNTMLSWNQGPGQNPYNTWCDTTTSRDGGNRWSIWQGGDAAFRVFGDRVTRSTTTAVTATPAKVAVSGVATIEVTVVDSNNDPVQGPGTVILDKSGGILGSPELTLKDGNASTTWTAASEGFHTISASFQGFSFAGMDYTPSSNDVSVDVGPEYFSTTTTLTLDPNSTTTRSQIDVLVSVIDNNGVAVTDGSVAFWTTPTNCGELQYNRCWPDGNGEATNTWTAYNTAGTFTIHAGYSGFYSQELKYGASDASDNITVDYTDVATTTTVRISPDYPYIYKHTYVIVEVREVNTGLLVPGGTVQISVPCGWCDSDNINLLGGMGSTKWYPWFYTPADVNITANYQETISGGNKYLASGSNGIAHVIKDNDITGAALYWMTEWVCDYNDYPLVNSGEGSRGFTNKIDSVLEWHGFEFGNQNAWQKHMAGREEGLENGYMDRFDFTWFQGHGKQHYILFSTEQDYPILLCAHAENAWGDQDADWVGFVACNVMSHHDFWEMTMNGIHLECGFHTNVLDSERFGEVFAGFMLKENVYDEPHEIHQAWFLASEQTLSTTCEARVIGENEDMFKDHIWGQGYVCADPVVDADYWGMDQKVDSNWPDANANGPYSVDACSVFQLDGSGSSDPPEGHYFFYAWDMNLSTNTDSGDWDLDGDDGNDDDADLWGRRPQYVFNELGDYDIRLMVIDDDWMCVTDEARVHVLPPGESSGRSAYTTMQAVSNDGIEIVDNYPNLPNETHMPIFEMVGTSVGYNEMMNIAEHLGMSGEAGLDDLGNWNMVRGDNELMVNQYSGSVMYVDMNQAYIYSGDPCGLLSEEDAIQTAQGFLEEHGIICHDVAVENITDMYAGQIQKGSRAPISSTPFQRRVNFQRTIDVNNQPYPVVGPGGKITVMINKNGDVICFTKVCRDVELQAEVELFDPCEAITKFHELGPKALIETNIIPPSNRIEIDNVSLGYYEDDFVTLRNQILPVYVLDLTCEDDKGSQRLQVYMSAMASPLQAIIQDPCTGTQADYGDLITFNGSAQGGTAPYTYAWVSDVNGLLASEPNFTTSSLGVNYQTDSCICKVLPHTISLAVTDDYGYKATEFVKLTVQGLCADFNHIDSVNFEDVAQFASCWLAQLGQQYYDKKVDFNKDSIIDMDDFCVLTGEWLK